MVAKKKYGTDLWPLLDNISLKNNAYYKNFSEEEVKGFVPFVIMRWLTGKNDGNRIAENAKQMFYLNEFVNPYVFWFTRRETMHKQLLYNLMTIACNGKKIRYKFNKVKKAESPMPLSVKIIQEVFDYNKRHAEDAIVLLDNPAILSMAEQLGRQEGELKELKKELRTKRPK